MDSGFAPWAPWALCVGVFLIYPMLAFVIGFYIGRKGMPFDVEIRRKPGWGKSLSDDEYGVAADAA